MVEDQDTSFVPAETLLMTEIANALINLSNKIPRKDQPTSFYTEIAGINSALQKMSARPPPPSVYD